MIFGAEAEGGGAKPGAGRRLGWTGLGTSLWPACRGAACWMARGAARAAANPGGGSAALSLRTEFYYFIRRARGGAAGDFFRALGLLGGEALALLPGCGSRWDGGIGQCRCAQPRATHREASGLKEGRGFGVHWPSHLCDDNDK